MATPNVPPGEYDTVELRSGRLHKIRLSEARLLGEEDRMVPVVKCYCRTSDVITPAEAEMQSRPSFVFPAQFFHVLEILIGSDLAGRIYTDTARRRVRFYLDLKEHAGFQHENNHADLQSPWYNDSVMKE